MRRVAYHSLFLASFLGSKALGLERTVKAFRRWGLWLDRVRPLSPAHDTTILRKRIERGHSFLPFPIQCLDQAIVTWFVLNRNGRPATLKIGIQLEPVVGHSWVEDGGEIYGDIATREDLCVVAEYGPWEKR